MLQQCVRTVHKLFEHLIKSIFRVLILYSDFNIYGMGQTEYSYLQTA